MAEIEYVIVGAERLDLVEPLWEKLRDHHKSGSQYFADIFGQMTFAAKKKKLSGERISKLRIDLVRDTEKNVFIGYCTSFVDSNLGGEIDSLFLMEDYRGQGIGQELVTRALTWLDTNQATSKAIWVAEGNETVLSFYRKFNFLPRATFLQQAKP